MYRNFYAMNTVDNVLETINNSKRIKPINVVVLPWKWETLRQAYSSPGGYKVSAIMDCEDMVSFLSDFATVINHGIVSHNCMCFSYGFHFKYENNFYYWKHTKDNDYIYKVEC